MINIQTMKLDLSNHYLLYKKPSKIWRIDKNKLIKFEYFEKLLKINNNSNHYLINDISDKEMELFLNFIENDNFDLNSLNINDIMLLIKISDYLLIPEVYDQVKKEFFNRLELR